MKKKFAALLLIMAMCAGLVQPAFAVSDNSTKLLAGEISVNEAVSDNDTGLLEDSSGEEQNDPEEDETREEAALDEEILDAAISSDQCGTSSEVEILSDAADEVSFPELTAEAAGLYMADGQINEIVLKSHLTSFECAIEEEFNELNEEEAGQTYSEDRAYFEADDKEMALEVADMYGAEFKSFDEGIGVIEFDTEESSLKNAVMESMYYDDVTVRIYPDYVNQLFEEESSLMTSDPAYSKQWFHDAISDNNAWKITDGKGVRVAVIDSGICQTHEDLKDNIEAAYACGYDTPEDENGHGSHCAGIIASVANNSLGGAGVAPGVKIVSIRAASAGGALYDSDILAAINKAIEEEVDVISMSFGGYNNSSAKEAIINKAVNKGITLVAAAGNECTSSVSYPAGYDNVISVASYDEDGALSYFSNYGSTVDIAAPGGNIYSTICYGGYDYMSGTSMACPVVAASAALIYASDESFTSEDANNADTPALVKSILLENADDKDYTYGGHSVHGGVNAYKAVAAVKDSKVTVEAPAKPSIASSADKKTGAVTVSINDIDDGAECFYTTDGSNPTINSTKYSGTSFVLSAAGTYTVKAIAVNKAKLSSGYKYASSNVTSSKIRVTIPKKAEYEDSELYVNANVNSRLILAAGKKVTVKGLLTPSNSKSKTVTYEIEERSGDVSASSNLITVNSKGVIKVSKNAKEGDKAHIRLGIKGCELQSGHYDTIEIVVKDKAVESVTSSYGKDVQTLYTVAYSKDEATTLDVAKSLTPATGESLSYRYTSSNTKVATVDKNGLVTAVGNGKANITALAMDGSGKKAVIRVKCLTPVMGISLKASTGQTESSRIAAGRSVKLTPVFTGTGNIKPSNRKVTWTSGNPSAVKVNKSGKVTALKTATEGTTVVITCTSADTGVTASYTFEVKGAVKYMGILKKSVDKYKYRIVGFYIIKSYQYTRNTYASSAKSSAVVQKGNVIDVSTPSSTVLTGSNLVYADSNKYYTKGNDDITKVMDSEDYIITMKSYKNVLVNSIDAQSGSLQKVSFSKKGTYSVIYKAVDGSGKKFTLKVRVQ